MSCECSATTPRGPSSPSLSPPLYLRSLSKKCRCYLPAALSSGLQVSTFLMNYPLSFQLLAHSFALFCISAKFNSFVFMRFRTLWQKHGGLGIRTRSSNASTLLRPTASFLLPPSYTRSHLCHDLILVYRKSSRLYS